LSDQYEATSYGPARRIYELTSEVHGDIDWAYAIQFDRRDSRVFPPLIGAAEVQRAGQEDDQAAAVERARKLLQSPADFVRTVVNPEITAQNVRLAGLRKNQLYRDAEDTPLLPEGDPA